MFYIYRFLEVGDGAQDTEASYVSNFILVIQNVDKKT